MAELIRKASEAEVVQYWLRREYEHRRSINYHVRTLFPEWVKHIPEENYADEMANARRLQMFLKCARWWFRDFRAGGEYAIEGWNLIRLKKEDMPKLVLINARDRREITNGTLMPMDAAVNIVSGSIKPERQSDANHILENHEQMAGENSRIVVVGPEGGPLTVVDGVHRTIALFLYYFVKNKGKFEAIEAYHGIAKGRYGRSFE